MANLCPMYIFIMYRYMFSEATTTVLESFTSSVGKRVLSLFFP